MTPRERAEAIVPDAEPESGGMGVWSVAGIEIRLDWSEACESVTQSRNAIIAAIKDAVVVATVTERSHWAMLLASDPDVLKAVLALVEKQRARES